MEIPRHWRLKKQRLRLEGEKLNCGHEVFPPRPTCPYCISLEDNIPNRQSVMKLAEQAEKEDKNIMFLFFLLVGFIITTLYVNKNSE